MPFTNLVFSVGTVSYGPSFFMAQAQSSRAINRRGRDNDILPIDLKLNLLGILLRKTIIKYLELYLRDPVFIRNPAFTSHHETTMIRYFSLILFLITHLH